MGYIIDEVQDIYQPQLSKGASPASIAHTVAARKAAEMRKKLKNSSPALMGWPGLTPAQLVKSEYDCWYNEELNIIMEALDNGDLSLPS